MSTVSIRRASAIAVILGFALVLLWLYQRSPERNEVEGRHAGVDAPKGETRPESQVSPLRTAPFLAQQPTERVVRISDLASGRAVVGAMVFADPDCTQAYSKAASDDDGKVTISLPDGMTALSPVYIKTRVDFGNAVIPATLPEPPEVELRIPVFARIIVSTSPPFIAESDVQPPEFGFLWCVSWPKPSDVLRQPVDTEISQRFESWHRNKEINSSRAPSINSVPYHDLINRTEGCDKRLAITHRRSVRPGAEETFDMPFSGEVLLSYFLPDLDTTKTALTVAAGNVHRVAIEAIASRKITLFIKDDAGNGVPDALVTVSLSREYDSKDPAVAFTSSFTPFGSQKSYTGKGWTMT